MKEFEMIWISLALLAACIGSFRWAMTLHSVPGSWMICVSGGLLLAGVFTAGIAVGQYI